MVIYKSEIPAFPEKPDLRFYFVYLYYSIQIAPLMAQKQIKFKFAGIIHLKYV